MTKFAIAITAAGALAAAPLSAQQPGMGRGGAPAECQALMAMHMEMLGGPGVGPMGGGMGGNGQHGGRAMGGGAMGGGAMGGGAMADHQAMMAMFVPPQALLSQRQALGLTDDQVSRIEHLQHERGEDVQESRDELAEQRQKAIAALREDEPDLDEYEHALKELSEERIEAHVAMLKAAMEARDVLTDAQRAKLPQVAQQLYDACSGPARR